MIEIDKNVTIPATAKVPASKAKYPFGEMEINDSFFVPGKTKMASTIASAAHRTGHKYDWDVRTEDGVEGVRIWRVEGETRNA